jgi:hypothetical protein
MVANKFEESRSLRPEESRSEPRRVSADGLEIGARSRETGSTGQLRESEAAT